MQAEKREHRTPTDSDYTQQQHSNRETSCKSLSSTKLYWLQGKRSVKYQYYALFSLTEVDV